MKKLFLCFLAFYCTELYAQDTVIIYGKGVTSEDIVLMKEKLNFKETNNRLFVEKKYDSIISFTAPYLDRSDYYRISILYTLSANYFLGNTTESKKLLDSLLSTFEDASNLFTYYDNIAFKSYLEVQENRDYLVNYIVTEYKKEKYPETENGIAIIRFFINDQWLRRNNRLIKYKTDSIEHSELYKMNNDSIFNFYKKNNRLFSKEEVGENVSIWQKLLLWHIDDKNQRAFLFPLVKKAVNEGYFSVKFELCH